MRISIPISISLAVLCLTGASAPANAQWTNLNNGFGSTTHLDTCVLLTNGDVMCHEYSSPNWHRRRPDNTGSYVNGTWDSPAIAPMPNGSDNSNVSGLTCTPCVYAPTYFASQLLPDGRVLVIGGEYNAQDGNKVVDTKIGFLYDPTDGPTGSWSTQISEPFGANVGDAPSILLENGTMLLGNINGTDFGQLNCSITAAGYSCASSPPSFSDLASNTKIDGFDEEGLISLPNNKILVVDANTATSSEIYDAGTNTWSSAGNTAGVSLTDLGNPTDGTGCNSHEVGPGLMRQDGTVMYFSGSTFGQNAVFNSNTSTWSNTNGMNFPVISGKQYGAADAPASLLPDGHVLVMSSPVKCNGPDKNGNYSIFNSQSHFFEWDGTNLTQVTDSANAGSFDSYQGRMILLPTGEVLLTAFDQNSTDTQQLYRNGNPMLTGYGPVITNLPPANLGLGSTYQIAGTNFNGFSLGAFYGDDSQSSTNYPLIRITDSASHTYYARAYNYSRMGIEAPSDTATTTSATFDVPTTLASGSASLVVVTNGFPSVPIPVNIQPATTISFASGVNSADYTDAVTVSAVLKTSGGTPLSGKTIAFVLGNGAGTESCSAPTGGTGAASCVITPNQVPAVYTLTASFAGDSSDGASTVSESFTITKEDTRVIVTGATTSDYHDAVIVSAQLTDPTEGTPIASKTLTFVLAAGTGTESCSASTDITGSAICSITPNQAAGNYSLLATYSGDAFYLSSAASVPFLITHEETTTAFTSGSSTVIANGHPVTLSATLLEDGTTPPVPSGQTVTFTLGSGITAQSCNGTTNASGLATCTIAIVNQPLGPNTVGAKFAGDPYYLPSSASESVILFAFLDHGSMIVGNLDTATGTAVEFWGAQWTSNNSLTGGPAPDSFKGFAVTSPQSCAGVWTGSPGNSGKPPATLPSYMGVIASSTIAQSASSITGNVPAIIVVKTNSGYAPDPGHAGTGTVVAVYCH